MMVRTNVLTTNFEKYQGVSYNQGVVAGSAKAVLGGILKESFLFFSSYLALKITLILHYDYIQLLALYQ